MHLPLLGTRIWAATVPGGPLNLRLSPCPGTGGATGMVPGQPGHGAPAALCSMLSQTRVPRTLPDGEPSHAGPVF